MFAAVLAFVMGLHFTLVAAAQNQPPGWNSVYSILKDGKTLWAGTGMGIEKIDVSTGDSTRTIMNMVFENRPRRILDSGDYVWIVRKFDVVRYDKHNGRIVREDLRQQQEFILDVAADEEAAWLLLSGRILRFDFTLKLWQEFIVFDAAAERSDFRTMESDEDVLWLGQSEGNICFVKKDDASLECPLAQEDIPYHVWTGRLTADHGTVWFHYQNNLMGYDVEENRVAIHEMTGFEGEAGRIVDLFLDGDGKLWYATSGATGFFDPAQGTFTTVYTPEQERLSGISGQFGDTLVLLTDRGLAGWNTDTETYTLFPAGQRLFDDYNPETTVIDNRVWIGFTGGEVVSVSPETGRARSIVPPCEAAAMLRKNMEGLKSARMVLPLTLERLAVTHLEKNGDMIWGTSRHSLAAHDETGFLWSVRRFETEARAYYVNNGFLLTSSGGYIYLCAPGDMRCIPPEQAVGFREKTSHLPTGVLRAGRFLYMATEEGGVYRFETARQAWATVLPVPARWKELHPAGMSLAGDFLWISRDNHIFRVAADSPGARIQLTTPPEGLPDGEILRLCPLSDAGAVAFTAGAIYTMSPGQEQWRRRPLLRNATGSRVTDCLLQGGDLWLAVSSLRATPGEVYHFSSMGREIDFYRIPAEYSTIYDLAPDEGKIWLGTSAGIAVMDMETGVTTLFSEHP